MTSSSVIAYIIFITFQRDDEYCGKADEVESFQTVIFPVSQSHWKRAKTLKENSRQPENNDTYIDNISAQSQYIRCCNTEQLINGCSGDA